MAGSMIFSECPRTDSGPKLSRESEFAFMDRSSRAEIARVREFLERLAGDYPESEHSELVARFRSQDDAAYKSAEFELLLYATLSRMGYRLEPHPNLPNGSKSKPDFLVTDPDGRNFYLEAVSPTEQHEEMGANTLTAQTLDVLTTNSHPNFLVAVRTNGTPKSQPSRNKFLKRVVRWLDGFDPDDVQNTYERDGHDTLPSMTWSHEDLDITVTALPIIPERRGKSERMLGIQSGGAGWISPKTVVRDAIRFKGTKYGIPDHPLVIAVNYDGYGLHRSDEVEALFGDMVLVIPIDDPDSVGSERRERNGAWFGASGPEFTRVSGAWIFDRLSPYSLSERSGTLYFNPYAVKSAPDSLRQLAHAHGSEDGVLHWSDGPTIGEILGVPKGWPEDFGAPC